MKTQKKYEVNDLVFAKVKGYPPWPAKITRIEKKRHSVYFYGTGETGHVKLEDLFKYVDNKTTYINDKNLKKNHFREAVDQIEAAACGDDSGPLQLDTPLLAETILKDEEQPEADNEEIEAPVDKKQPIVLEEKPQIKKKAVATPKTPIAQTYVVKKEIISSPGENKEGVVEPEVVSRSGRKIKPKKYLDQEEEPVVSSSSQKRKANNDLQSVETKNNKVSKTLAGELHLPNPIPIPSTSKVSQKKVNSKNNLNKISEIKKLEETVKVNNENRIEILEMKHKLLLVLTAKNQVVGIKVDLNKPAKFENDEIRLKWDRDACIKAKEIKQNLEMGVVTVEELGNLIDFDPNITKKQHADLTNAKKYLSQLSQLNSSMKLETRLTELNQMIKSTVGLNKADPDICIKLLDEYKSMELITPLMLKKNPNCVETMKRMRRYVGNTKKWEMSEELEKEFNIKTGLIRNRAEQIYNSFKRLFKIPEGLTFVEAFRKEVEIFDKKTLHLSSADLFLLTDESTIDENTETDDINMEKSDDKEEEKENENIVGGDTEDSDREEENDESAIQSDDFNQADKSETNGFNESNSP